MKLAVPAVVGEPLITPAAENVRAAGKAPDVMDHKYGGVPPVADIVWEYVEPTVPAGKGEAVDTKSGGGFTVIEKALVPVREPLSVT
jgi:hypothetical protein